MGRDWIAVVSFGIAVAASVALAFLGHNELASGFMGLAGGILVPTGLGRRKAE